MKSKYVLKTILVFIAAFSIPVLLLLNGIQAQKYMKLEDDIKSLESKQVALIEENKKLVTDISVLSSSDRIEKIAKNELGMHKAESQDILRVEVGKKDEK